jgi:hypothetical protein
VTQRDHTPAEGGRLVPLPTHIYYVASPGPNAPMFGIASLQVKRNTGRTSGPGTLLLLRDLQLVPQPLDL